MITEKNYIRQLLKGNEDALMYVVDNYGGLVKFIAHKYLYRCPEDEKECINDVFLSVWQNIAYYDETKNSFKNWVAVITKYKAINILKKQLNRIEEIAIDNIELVSEETAEREIMENIISEETEQMLSCLSEQDRGILIKCYAEDINIDEIGKLYNLKPASVYSRISRAKKKLRSQIQKGGSQT
ncbi:MAG: sigma-70 family RNA polymerase sigma factor [Lachnospiraceae bacterium]|nr:sigma-70 family RNA polymerase sigma factor [Lachnospiraceae bacterium]